MIEETPLRQSNAASAFRTTCWTDVLAVARQDSNNGEAFSRFYTGYWRPIYCYVRRRGLGHAEAEECTQDFFVSLLQKHRLRGLEREGGRFRSFLLTSMQNYLANLWDKRRAAKRGGGVAMLSIDDTTVAERIGANPDDAPELAYDREWARLILERAMQALECECAQGKKERLFAALREKLQSDRGRPCSEIALELDMTEGSVKVAVHRLRARYGELLREEVARTVESPEAVQDELRHLRQVLSS